jgi:hypothetical protein
MMISPLATFTLSSTVLSLRISESVRFMANRAKQVSDVSRPLRLRQETLGLENVVF